MAGEPGASLPATWTSLPRELKAVALQSVDAHTLGAAACSCQELREVAEQVMPLLAREEAARGVIAAGSLHSAVVDAHGSLYTFGIDPTQRGFLGLGAAEACLPTRVPMAGVRFASVAAHSFHTLALTACGSVYSFGHGQCGQLGHGDLATLSRPRRIEALSSVRAVAVSAGQQHSLVLSAGGAPYAFGSGFGGKLGLGDQQPRPTPARIGAALSGVPVRVVAAGGQHSLVASQRRGEVYSFGSNASSQLGHGDRSDERTPRLVEALRGKVVLRLAAGEHHSLALDESGACYSWGAGEARERTSAWAGGWLGHRAVDDCPLPRRVESLGGVRVVAVAAAGRHSLLLAADGGVYSFGDGGGGKLGHDDGGAMHWVPSRVRALDGVRAVAVSAGDSHSMCALRDGRVLVWGCGRALGLEQSLLSEVDQPASWSSAGNHEWVPGDEQRRWQAHAPMPLRVQAGEVAADPCLTR